MIKTKDIQKGAVNAIAEAIVSRLVYNNEFGMYELPAENLFTISKPVAEYAAKELGIELKAIQETAPLLTDEVKGMFLKVLQTAVSSPNGTGPGLQGNG
jgi:hypothetical protein